MIFDVLGNEAMPGLVKTGKTANPLTQGDGRRSIEEAISEDEIE